MTKKEFFDGMKALIETERQRCEEAYKAGYIKGGLDEQVTNNLK